MWNVQVCNRRNRGVHLLIAPAYFERSESITQLLFFDSFGMHAIWLMEHLDCPPFAKEPMNSTKSLDGSSHAVMATIEAVLTALRHIEFRGISG